MSNYVKLVSERKKALLEGEEEKARKLFDEITTLVKSGKVTDDELKAGAYL